MAVNNYLDVRCLFLAKPLSSYKYIIACSEGVLQYRPGVSFTLFLSYGKCAQSYWKIIEVPKKDNC